VDGVDGDMKMEEITHIIKSRGDGDGGRMIDYVM